ncbi:hypothetical protein CsSME_00006799 [Camellia sinensis var. sinensis]
MADLSHGRASFGTQANALLRKNLTFQKRNIKENVRLILFPFLLCVLLVLVQSLINTELDKPKNKCGCACSNGKDICESNERVCGIQYSTLSQVATCPIPSPPEWPPLFQIPGPKYRAAKTDFSSFTDLPAESCKNTGTCPATILYTGNNQSFGEILAGNMLSSSSTLNSSDLLNSFADNIMGSDTMTDTTNLLEPAFFSNEPVYHLQPQCSANSTTSVSIQTSSFPVSQPQGIIHINKISNFITVINISGDRICLTSHHMDTGQI